MDDRSRRILRQHVRTDALLGVEQAPVGRRVDHAATADAPTDSTAAPDRDDPTTLDRSAKAALLERLDVEEVRGCTKCGLCESRTQTVFGEGAPDAEVMFIGEGPGQQEDEQGRPFVGRAGQLLDKMIAAMGYERGEVYIANVVKCRPPNNRTPTAIEANACWEHLRRQIEIIRPKAIVTLGGPAAKMVLNTTEGITRLRGTWHEFPGVEPPIPVMPTFHPAYLLRSYTPDNRRKVWSDLQAVMQRVGRPVSG